MTPKVFICYRREDSQDVAGRIYDRLVSDLTRANVFKDTDSIQLGKDWRRAVRKSVQQCNVVLAIIGPNWLTAVDDKGKRRLDARDDAVRFELETALEKNIPVIPLLAGGAKMPQDSVLPSGIRPISRRQGLPIRSDPDFSRDMALLLNSIRNNGMAGSSDNAQLVQIKLSIPDGLTLPQEHELMGALRCLMRIENVEVVLRC